MKVLVLGGTRFIGRHMVTSAFARGHEVTLFNRGRTNPNLFPNAKKLIGDRDGNLEGLRNYSWDVVIDLNGYFPRLVDASSRLLADRVERYIFLSTLAVYEGKIPYPDESAPLATIDNPRTEQVTTKTYGPLKVLCEQTVEKNLPARTTLLRSGHVAGPHDHTDRFTYWVRRISQGGEILAPGESQAPFQCIDARDLAKFTFHLIESGAIGKYNITGPDHPITWFQFFEECRLVSASDTAFTWVSEAFLDAHLVAPNNLPLWPQATDPKLMPANCEKARAAGLKCRSLSETIRDTLEWAKTQGPLQAGLSRERERILLQAWHDLNENQNPS